MGQRRHAETLQHRHTLLGRGCLNLSAGFGGRFCWFRFYSCEHFKALKVVDIAGIDSDRQPGGALHEHRGYIDRQLTLISILSQSLPSSSAPLKRSLRM